MEIILIRHFMTPGNLRRCYIGSTDEALLPEQKPVIAYSAVDVVISSPLRRCLQTAAIIYPDKQPLVCDDLRECDFGIFEGKCYEELKEHSAYQQWLDSGGTSAIPKGESSLAFRARCIHSFRELVTKLAADGCNLAAFVVHGGTIMALLAAFDPEGKGFYHWQAGNGEGYRVKLDAGKWQKGIQLFTEIRKL